MSVSEYFASTYAEARDKFLAAAQAARARTAVYALPNLRGPGNEELSIDVAKLGPHDPDAVLVLLSGTHGVEGFGGSGCQVGYLTDQLHEALPPGTGTLLVHALNPHGFAWLRRVNENNIDLNRNFRDFSRPLPGSSAYEAVHDCLVPNAYDGPERRAADDAIEQYVADRGIAEFLAAVTGGQYTRPSGLFYGGTAECWSNRTFRRILKEHVPATTNVLAVLDFHTGLGPIGYGEPIYVGFDDMGLQRARKWYGCEVTSTSKGTSTSAVVTGALSEAFLDLDPKLQVTHLAIEYGTRPVLEVIAALRADNWLHTIKDCETPFRGEIKREIRNAFYVDTPAWKAAVYGRSADFVLRASRGLRNSEQE
jgi:hypothetical protein